MSNTWQKIFVWASLLSFIAAYNLRFFLWKGFYYHGMAAGILFLFVVLREIKQVRLLATIGMWLSINNLADEVFFDPTAIEWNEYIVALIIILTTYRNGRKLK